MSELSLSPAERARKAHSTILQRLKEHGVGVALSTTLGVSESTISRLKNDQLESVLALVYALGFKVVPQCKTCINTDALEFMRQTTARVLSNQEQAQQLFRDDE